MAFYSATRDDVFFPARRGQFFAVGQSDSEAALCAEMSRLAYCRQDQGVAFDRERIADVLRTIGFEDCQFFEIQPSVRHAGTHAFLARRTSADPAGNLAVLSFRGTDDDDITDLGADADFLLTSWERGGKVHSGFAGALLDVQDDLLAALETVTCRLLFTGHSFGAALATLLASLRAPTVLYTIGSPRVGDADFVEVLKTIDCHRFVDCCDFATSLPPELLGYVHLGEAHYIDRHRNLAPGPDGPSEEEDRHHARLEYLVEYAWRRGNVAVRDLADHAPINYVTAIP